MLSAVTIFPAIKRTILVLEAKIFGIRSQHDMLCRSYHIFTDNIDHFAYRDRCIAAVLVHATIRIVGYGNRFECAVGVCLTVPLCGMVRQIHVFLRVGKP